MLYLIGMGLNEQSISKEALDAVSRCKRVYLENYTIDLPYNKIQVEEVIHKKVIEVNREKVENMEIVDESKKLDVVLLIYGSPLTATTHIALIQEAKASGVKTKIIYNASILDAVAETGLQLYKFGKITSMPKWQKNFEPDSFVNIIKENRSIGAHSLILIDIGLELNNALNQLEKSCKKNEIELKKIIICQALGTKFKKIFYGNFEDLKEYKNIKKPYCFIIPEKLHFLEKEVLEEFER